MACIPDSQEDAFPAPASPPPAPQHGQQGQQGHLGQLGQAAPATPGMAASLAMQWVGRAKCWFDCGQAGNLADLVNIGNRRSPRMVCHACNNARKAIETQVRKDKANRDLLNELKRTNPETWKRKVRSCRILASSQDDDGQPDNLASRRKAIGAFVQELSSFIQVHEELAVLWPNHDEYVGHKMANMAMTRDEAEASWRADMANPDIQRRGHGPAIRVAIQGIPQTIGQRGRVAKRTLEAAEGVESKEDEQMAFTRMRQSAFGHALTDADFQDAGGSAFRPGAAASSGFGGPNPMVFPTEPGLATPLPRSILESMTTRDNRPGSATPAACWPAPGTPGHLPMPIAQASGQPDAPSGESPPGDDAATASHGGQRAGLLARAKARGASGAGQMLLSQREQAMAKVKHVKKDYLARANHTAILVETAMAKLDEEQREPCTAPLAAYKKHLASILDMGHKIPQWTMANFLAEGENLERAIQELATARAQLLPVLLRAKEKIRLATTEKAKVARKSALQATKATKLFRDNRVPNALCSLMLDWKIITEPEACAGQGQYLPSGHQAPQAAMDWAKPAWFRPEDAGHGASFRQLPAAMGPDRVSEATTRVNSFLDADPKGTKGTGLLRLAPKGAPRDTLEGLAWVPEELKASGAVPEALRQYGAPWFVAHHKATLRATAGEYPFPGLGHVLVGLQGQFWVCAWPVRILLDLDVSPAGAMTFLSGQPAKHLATFFRTHGFHFLLKPNVSAWIPYGWQAICVAMGEPDHSSLLHQPFMSSALASKEDTHVMQAVSEELLAFVRKNQTAAPWDKLATQFTSWLTTLSPGSRIAPATPLDQADSSRSGQGQADGQ